MKTWMMIACAIGFGACANTPSVGYTYYGAKADLTVTVTQTAGCSEELKPVFTSDVKFTNEYSRNENLDHSFNISALSGSFSDADISIETYPDGRLKGLNASTTGKGKDVFDSVLKLGQRTGAFDAEEQDKEAAACAALREINPKGPVTVVRRASITLTNSRMADEVDHLLRQETLAPTDWKNVKTLYGDAILSFVGLSEVDGHKWSEDTAFVDGGSQDKPHLVLWRPMAATARVSIEKPGMREQQFESQILAPGLGTPYQLPIPKAVWFGGTEMELSVDKNGSVTKLKYGTTSGFADGAAALTGFIPDDEEVSTADRAKEIKAQGDLIAYQQRLVRCQLDPEACS